MYHMEKGIIFDIKNFSIHDGPGIRTTVFIKGCPLKCLWCSNPESQKTEPQLMTYSDRCVHCGKCNEICPTGAAEFDKTIWEKCLGCGKCAEVCLKTARQLIGRWVTSEDVVKEVIKDKLLYDKSGGGVTLGGGDAVSQPVFAADILKMCKEQGIHTLLDTCGFCKWESLCKMINYADMVYYDIKCIDPVKHLELTGVCNNIILKNLKHIDKSGIKFAIRIPIIPGYNDSEKILSATGEYLEELKSDFTVFLLPYHAYGKTKYERLGLEYKLREVKNVQKESLLPIKDKLEKYGLKVKIQ